MSVTGGADRAEVQQPVQEYLASTFLVAFGENGLEASSNLFDLGVIDSYGLVQTVSFIEERFGLKLTDDELLSPDMSSLDGMVTLIRRKLGA